MNHLNDEYLPLSLPYFIGSQRSLYSESTLRVHMLGHRSKPWIRGQVTFGLAAEGPPRNVHGGMVAYVLDEAMGTCAWHAGHPVLAQEIRVFFRKLVPLNRAIRIEARVTRTQGRNIYICAKLLNDAGVLLSESKGHFRRIRPDLLSQFESLAGQKLS